jgi:hypothetical protein
MDSLLAPAYAEFLSTRKDDGNYSVDSEEQLPHSPSLSSTSSSSSPCVTTPPPPPHLSTTPSPPVTTNQPPCSNKRTHSSIEVNTSDSDAPLLQKSKRYHQPEDEVEPKNTLFLKTNYDPKHKNNNVFQRSTKKMPTAKMNGYTEKVRSEASQAKVPGSREEFEAKVSKFSLFAHSLLIDIL